MISIGERAELDHGQLERIAKDLSKMGYELATYNSDLQFFLTKTEDICPPHWKGIKSENDNIISKINFVHKVELAFTHFYSYFEIDVFSDGRAVRYKLPKDLVLRLRELQKFLMKETMFNFDELSSIRPSGLVHDYEAKLCISNDDGNKGGKTELTSTNIKKYVYDVAKKVPTLMRRSRSILSPIRKGRM